MLVTTEYIFQDQEFQDPHALNKSGDTVFRKSQRETEMNFDQCRPMNTESTLKHLPADQIEAD